MIHFELHAKVNQPPLTIVMSTPISQCTCLTDELEHLVLRDALIENGIDPDDLLGDGSNQVSFGQLDEIKSVIEQCVPAVIAQSASTLLLPVLMGISLQVRLIANEFLVS